MDYNKIFSLVVQHTSIHVLQALVETLDMDLEQLNVKTTFLHGRLKEDIMIQQPEGFEMQGKKIFV